MLDHLLGQICGSTKAKSFLFRLYNVDIGVLPSLETSELAEIGRSTLAPRNVRSYKKYTYRWFWQ